MFNIGPESITLLIPIIAIIGGITIAIFGVIAKGKEEELKHKERILAMEKGIAVPEMPKEEKRPSYLRLRTWGIVLTLIGIAIIIAKSVRGNLGDGIWGVMPAAIGVGLLIAAVLERRDMEKK